MKILLEKSLFEVLDLVKDEIDDVVTVLTDVIDDLHYVSDKENDEFYREKVLEDAINSLDSLVGKLKSVK